MEIKDHVHEFHDILSKSPDTAVAVAAIKAWWQCSHLTCTVPAQALTSAIRSSRATTMMELDHELKDAAKALQKYLATMCAFLSTLTHTGATQPAYACAPPASCFCAMSLAPPRWRTSGRQPSRS